MNPYRTPGTNDSNEFTNHRSDDAADLGLDEQAKEQLEVQKEFDPYSLLSGFSSFLTKQICVAPHTQRNGVVRIGIKRC